jgi:hypothetical protein
MLHHVSHYWTIVRWGRQQRVIYLLTHSQSLSRENCREVSRGTQDTVEEHTIGTSCCKLLGKSDVPMSAFHSLSAAGGETYPGPGWPKNWGQQRALDSVLEVGPVTLGSPSWTLSSKVN